MAKKRNAACKELFEIFPQKHPDLKTNSKDTRPNQATYKTQGALVTTWRGKERGQNKKRVKTLPNSTVTLMPRLLSFLDSSTSNSSPGRRLLTPGALPFKLPMMCSCEQRTGHEGELSQAETCKEKQGPWTGEEVKVTQRRK